MRPPRPFVIWLATPDPDAAFYCCRKTLTSGGEQLIDGVSRLPAKRRKDMRVRIHRDADLRVPEYTHDDATEHGRSGSATGVSRSSFRPLSA